MLETRRAKMIERRFNLFFGTALTTTSALIRKEPKLAGFISVLAGAQEATQTGLELIDATLKANGELQKEAERSKLAKARVAKRKPGTSK